MLKKRRRQRGISELEIKHVLEHPAYVKKSFEGTKEAAGEIRNRMLRIKFIEKESYIEIITIV